MNKEYKTFEELKEELGDKFEEFMYKANIELLEKVNQLETNREEAIEYIKHSWRLKLDQIYDVSKNLSGWEAEEVLSILERGKE